MIGWLGDGFLWVKAAHLFFVIAWMAGLLYLPRLFAYHAAAAQGSESAQTFEVMERRLLRGIMNPSMVLVWILGLMLLAHTEGWRFGWMHGKLLLVVILTVIHHLLALWRKDLAAGRSAKSARFFKIINEAPAVILILVLILVVVRPF